MNRRTPLYAVTTALLVPLALTLPAFAIGDKNEEQPRQKQVTKQADRQEMAALIKQGQLRLSEATKLAEAHSKGVALEASCEILPLTREQRRQAEQAVAANQRPNSAALRMTQNTQSSDVVDDDIQPAGKRIVYTVTCFANGKSMDIRVDALAKRVIEDHNDSMSDAHQHQRTSRP